MFSEEENQEFKLNLWGTKNRARAWKTNLVLNENSELATFEATAGFPGEDKNKNILFLEANRLLWSETLTMSFSTKKLRSKKD